MDRCGRYGGVASREVLVTNAVAVDWFVRQSFPEVVRLAAVHSTSARSSVRLRCQRWWSRAVRCGAAQECRGCFDDKETRASESDTTIEVAKYWRKNFTDDFSIASPSRRRRRRFEQQCPSVSLPRRGFLRASFRADPVATVINISATRCFCSIRT